MAPLRFLVRLVNEDQITCNYYNLAFEFSCNFVQTN